MKARQLQDPVDLEEALTAERYLLFKHSKTCEISTHAWKQMDLFLTAHPDIPFGWLDVRAQRPLSNVTAERTGITHESPQVFWIRDGKVVWHASHFDITPKALASATTT